MMGHQQRVQKKLFYTKLDLDQRIRKDHILRKVKNYIDFDFVYNEVKVKYGINGIPECATINFRETTWYFTLIKSYVQLFSPPSHRYPLSSAISSSFSSSASDPLGTAFLSRTHSNWANTLFWPANERWPTTNSAPLAKRRQIRIGSIEGFSNQLRVFTSCCFQDPLSKSWQAIERATEATA